MTELPRRGSWQARTVRRVSAHTARRVAAAAPVNSYTLPLARTLIERTLRAVAPVLPGTRVTPVASGRVRGEWVRGSRAGRTDAAVLYVHGGGFVAGSAAGYRGVAARLSTATRLPVFTLDYRLAPEHPYPAAPLDLEHAFRWLTRRGYAPGRIVVAGDSAGGFLTADFVITRTRTELPTPGGVVLFSPMADLSLGVATGYAGARACGLLSARLSRRAVTHFTPDPYELVPTTGKPLPPALVLAGDTEFFGGDAVALARRWRETGTVCELQVWPDQIHAFPVLPLLIPESRHAYRTAARFVAEVLDTTAAAV